MAEPTKSSQEPSMEEILSSIRRIIADEDGGEAPPAAGAGGAGPGRAERAGPGGRAAPSAPAPAATEAREDDEEVLELTEVVDPGRQGPPPPPPPQPPRPAPMVPPRARAAEDPVRSSTPMSSSPEGADGLISAGTASASAQALSRLTRAAVGGEDRGGGSPLAQVTVERLLVDLLTPVLKEWLDQNLPQLVERVVEQEVKKLARRAELL